VVFINGEVIRKFEEGGKKLVEIKQEATTQTGEVSAFGGGVVELS
jgi:hypothetical protein